MIISKENVKVVGDMPISQRDVRCPYCQNQAVLMTTEQFYGKDFGTNMWVCRPCQAYVGTHHRTDVPLGTLANKTLREWRKKVHQAVDPMWKSRQMTRSQVYKWIQEAMNLSQEEAHIGMMNEEQCQQLLLLCEQKGRKSK